MITDFWIANPEESKPLMSSLSLDSDIQITQEEKQMVKDILIS